MDVVRVIVTGGTGFIGRSLVRSFAERGDDVVILSRGTKIECPGPRKSCSRGAGKVELATWTPEQGGDWQKVVDGAEAIVHLAGAGVMDEPWTPQRREVLRSSRIRSTELLTEAIQKASKKPRVFVSSSAVGYYGMKTGDRLLTESDAPGDDFLAKLVVDWEAASANAGVRTCNPRIGIVLGKAGGALAKLLPFFRAFVGGPVGDGKQYVPWIHVADTVSAIEHAIATETLEGPFDVTAPEPVTFNELARALGDALHRPAILRVPSFAMKLAMGEQAQVLLTGQRAIPKRLVDSGFAFLFPELASALADLVAHE